MSAISDAFYAKLEEPFRTTVLTFLYQFLCFCFLLGPVRLVFNAVILLFSTIAVLILGFVFQTLGFHSLGKSVCLAVARFGIRCVLFGFGIFFVNVKGALDESARFLIANHIGVLDAFILFFLHDFSCTIDFQYRSIPALRILLAPIEPIYLHYDQREQIRRNKITEHVDSFQRPPVLLFPEGLSSRGCGEVLMKFDPTAFSTPYRLQPIALKYHMMGVPKNWNTYAYRGETVWSTIWRLLSMPPSLATVAFLPPISLGAEGKADVVTFVGAAQLSMANAMGIQAVDRSG